MAFYNEVLRNTKDKTVPHLSPLLLQSPTILMLSLMDMFALCYNLKKLCSYETLGILRYAVVCYYGDLSDADGEFQDHSLFANRFH